MKTVLSLLLSAVFCLLFASCAKDEELGSGDFGVRIQNDTGVDLENLTFTFNFDDEFVANVSNLSNGATSLYYQFEYADWCNFRLDASNNGESLRTGYWICAQPEPFASRRTTVTITANPSLDRLGSAYAPD